MTVDNQLQYTWRRAVKEGPGLVYMILERVFFILHFISMEYIAAYCLRKIQSNPYGKRKLIIQDIYPLFSFIIVGLIIPILLISSNSTSPTYWFGFLGIYLITKITQEEINVTLFDSFRLNNLVSFAETSTRWTRMKDTKIEWLLLRFGTLSNTQKTHVLYSGRRRVVFAVLAFWKLFVSFSLVYWSWIPRHFEPCLNQYVNALYFSVVTGTTLGYGEILPNTSYSKAVIIIHTLLSLLFTIIIIAKTLSLLPEEKMRES